MKTFGVFWNINFERGKATCRFPHFLLETRHLLSSISSKALAILNSLHFRGRFSKVPVIFRVAEIKYSNRNIKNKSAGPG